MPSIDESSDMPRRAFGRAVRGVPDGTWRSGTAAVVIRRDSASGKPRMLLGRRTGAHGAGTWAFPGGKPESGESVFATAVRELFEETGLHGQAKALLGESYDDLGLTEPGSARWCTSLVLVTADEGEPAIMEPGKCTAWGWFSLEEMPSPLFNPIVSFMDVLVEAVRTAT